MIIWIQIVYIWNVECICYYRCVGRQYNTRVCLHPVRNTTQNSAMDVISHPHRERHAHGHSRRCSWMHPHVLHTHTHTHRRQTYTAHTCFLTQERGWRAEGEVVQCKRDATSRRCRTNGVKKMVSVQDMMSASEKSGSIVAFILLIPSLLLHHHRLKSSPSYYRLLPPPLTCCRRANCHQLAILSFSTDQNMPHVWERWVLLLREKRSLCLLEKRDCLGQLYQKMNNTKERTLK